MCDRQQRLRRTWDGERSMGTVLNKIFLLGQLYPHLVSGNLCQDHMKWKQCWSWHCCSPLGFLAACHLPKGNMPWRSSCFLLHSATLWRWTRAGCSDGTWLLPDPWLVLFWRWQGEEYTWPLAYRKSKGGKKWPTALEVFLSARNTSVQCSKWKAFV